MLVNNIINHLEHNDMKIADFAKKCGVKPSTISNILNGYTKNPTIEVVSKIAKAMNMTIDELTRNDKREIDEVKKIYDKMKNLDESEKAKIYAMMTGAINATIEYRDD